MLPVRQIPSMAPVAYPDIHNSILHSITCIHSLTAVITSDIRAEGWSDASTMHTVTQMLDSELHLLSERTNARQYNKPTVAEVAALITNDFGDETPSRDIIVNKLHSGPKRISELHPTYMALQYPLLFLYGEDGFHDKIPYYTNSSHRKTNRDDIISAELPSPTEDPDGYKLVTDYMLHGPCGKDRKYATCTTEGKCSKHYPKQFYAKTVLDEDGYPIYRRRENKVSFKKGKFTFDNKHVVPHNRYLLLKYQTHLNVEWCNRSKAIKYLFKYLNKGHDRATVVIQENVQKSDHVTSEKIMAVVEINNYLNYRYLAPCEAVWRLFSFDIHYSFLSVMKLNFHLPNQNPVTLRDSEFLPALLEREGINVTMFTDWFDLNERDPSARTLTYAELPKLYVWHEQLKMWKPQKQKKCIGRIVYSTPALGERYFLRMLLNVVRGPKDFDELMIVNNRLCHTFKEACFTYGLLNDDREWTKAIAEASLWALGPQLRDLFVTILLFCDVSRPLKLWKETWNERSLTDFQDLPRLNP
ncbi:hypothetical protein Tco_0829306 [Tanacetum coccineum]